MKKKLLIALITLCVVLVSAATGAYAATKMKITVNDKPSSIQPKLIGNTAYLPLRDMAGLLGIDITYDQSTNTIALSTDNKNAMPDPEDYISQPTADAGTSAAAVDTVWKKPTQEQVNAINIVDGYLTGLNQYMDLRNTKHNITKEECRIAIDDAIKGTKESFKVLKESGVPLMVEYGKRGEATLADFDKGMTSEFVIDNQNIKSGIEGMLDIYFQLLKLIPQA